MMTLADLIATRKGDATYEALAERGGMSPSALHKYASGLNKDFPPPESVIAIAKAIDVAHSEVVVAAAYGLGLEVEALSAEGGPSLGRLLPPDVDNLPPHAQRAIVDFARTMITLMYGEEPASEGAPQAARSAARRPEVVVRVGATKGRRAR